MQEKSSPVDFQLNTQVNIEIWGRGGYIKLCFVVTSFIRC